jgi:hypothetical protein
MDWRELQAKWREEENEKLRAEGFRADLIRESRRHGRVCGHCGGTLSRTMHVRRVNVCGFTALFCRTCAAKRWYGWSESTECRSCGRPFVFQDWIDRKKPHTPWMYTRERPAGLAKPRACCVSCENRLAYNARRVAATDRPCLVCGEAFTAKRSDAKTCGPTCRQKLRRREVAKKG